MKLERYLKFFCFGFAVCLLISIYSKIVTGITELHQYLKEIGIFLICIEYGVLMRFDQLSRKVTFKSLFSISSEKVQVTEIGVFANVLGRIGMVLLVAGFVMSFMK